MTRVVTLKSEKDFAYGKFRKSMSSLNFRIRVAPNTDSSPRFGFIIPKKVLPKVTDRNKIKRRLKQIVSFELTRMKPVDVLIFPQKNSKFLTYDQCKLEILRTFNKLGLWKS